MRLTGLFSPMIYVHSLKRAIKNLSDKTYLKKNEVFFTKNTAAHNFFMTLNVLDLHRGTDTGMLFWMLGEYVHRVSGEDAYHPLRGVWRILAVVKDFIDDVKICANL